VTSRRPAESSGEDEYPYRLRHRPKLGEHLLGALGCAVGYHIADLPSGPQSLAFDVDPVVGEQSVERGEHARRVAMHDSEAVGAGSDGQVDVGHVDRQGSRPVTHEVDELLGDELADVDLRLFCATADMGCQDHVRESLKPGCERPLVACGLLVEHVHRRTGDPAGLYVSSQGAVVHQESPAQVQEERTGSHGRELVLAEHVPVVRSAVDVEGDHVSPGEQVLQGCETLGVPQGEAVRDVEEADGEPEALGEHRKLGAYVAVTDDAQPSTSDFVGPSSRLGPHPGVHVRVLVGKTAGQCDDLGYHQLHDRAGVGERRVEDRDPLFGRSCQVDLVRSDAERSDGDKLVCLLEDLGRQVRAGAYPDETYPSHPLDQLSLVESPFFGLHCKTGLSEPVRRPGVDVLQK